MTLCVPGICSSSLLLTVIRPASCSEGPKCLERSNPSRTDRYGDPLPTGPSCGLARCGSAIHTRDSLAYSPDGTFVVSGGYDKQIRLWDPDTGKELRTLEGLKELCELPGSLRRWQMAGFWQSRWRSTACGRLPPENYNGVFLGMMLQLSVWPCPPMARSSHPVAWPGRCDCGTRPLAKKSARCRPTKDYRVLAMVFTPDSKQFAFLNRSEMGIQLVNVADGKVDPRFHGPQGRCFRFDLHWGRYRSLISGGYDKTIRAWEVATGNDLRRYGDGKTEVTCPWPWPQTGRP